MLLPVADLNMPNGPLLTLDLTPRPVPPRSKLYSLKPLGIGTPYVESLIGYAARLAEAHHVRLATLKDLLPGCEPHSCHGSLSGINGSLITAARCREAIESLTCQQVLDCLTMLKWSRILPKRGLFKKHLAWCPNCFEFDHIPYWRLLWALQAVEACPIHRCPLQKVCPYCYMCLPRASGGMRPGFCSLCSRWLGSETYGSETTQLLDNGADVSIADLAGKLLAAANGITCLGEFPVRRALQEAYSLNKSPGGMPMHDVLQIRSTLYYIWRTNRCNPPLSSVLDLCGRLKICPVQLLTTGSFGCMEGWQTTRFVVAVERPRRRQRRFMDVQKVKRHLAFCATGTMMQPPTLAMVAHKMEFHPNVLWRRFPDLCHSIVQRNKAHQKLCTEQKLAAVAGEIKAIVREMHETGVELTRRHVASRMKHPAFLRNTELMEVLKTAFATRR